MRQKYYFISYTDGGIADVYNKLINVDPIEWQMANNTFRLITWQEITQEEYEDHNESFNCQ